MTLTALRAADDHTRKTLAREGYSPIMVRWDDLMGDLYRAADQTWNVHLIDEDTWNMIVWANRVHATNDDRRALVLFTMRAVREDMGADEDLVRDLMRDDWTRRRAETDHRTYAVPFDDHAMAVAMAPAEYDHALFVATRGSAAHRASLVDDDGRTYSARGLFDVLVLA